MPIEFPCPNCGKSYRVGDDKAGRTFKCQKCQSAVKVPEGAPDDEFGAVVGEDFGNFDYGGMSAPVSHTPKKSAKSKSNKKKQKKQESNTGLLIGIAVGVVAFVGIAIGVWALFLRGDGNGVAGTSPPSGDGSAANAGGGGASIPAPTPRSQTELGQMRDKLFQIGIAMHNYQDSVHALPVGGRQGGIVGASEWFDENGKPHLSWRVHILPFMDERELFEQFHLNESWDSPHNSALISQLPTSAVS